MTANMLSLAIIVLTYTHSIVNGFSINSKLSVNGRYVATNELQAMIEADIESDEVFVDPGLAPVQQAKESAAVMLGSVQTDEDQINPVAEDLKLYNKLTPLSGQDEVKGTVLCKGMGTEAYTDPGSSTQRLVTIAPKDAVKNALSAMDANPDGGKLRITFAGGDDLMIHEVLQGVEMMTSGLNLGSGTSVEFRSLCHKSFPLEKCGVAAVNVKADTDEGAYFHDGQWWTCAEDDFTSII